MVTLLGVCLTCLAILRVSVDQAVHRIVLSVRSLDPIPNVLNLGQESNLTVATWNSNTNIGQRFSDDNQELQFPCKDRQGSSFGRLEDIFCLRLPPFLPNLTNPCFYDIDENMKTKMRCLPYFYILGQSKCGTTDLHGRMMYHPLIRNNKGVIGKEATFWAWGRFGIYHKMVEGKNRTIEHYLNTFANTALEIQASLKTSGKHSQIITGDASPMDLTGYRGWRHVPHNQGLAEPKVMTPHFMKHLYRGFVPKFFIQLREPVDRLFSDYVFQRGGKTPEQFHGHAITALAMIQDCEKNHSRRWCYYSDELYQKLPTRIHWSCYSVYIADWFSVYPREAFHVSRIDDLQHDMAGVMTSVFHFMGVGQPSADVMAEMLKGPRQHTTKAKVGLTVLPKTRLALKDYVDRCNRETAALLNDDRFLWKDHVF